MITAQKSPVYISKHLNGKMEDMHAISTNTLTNFYCNKMHKEDIRGATKVICKSCYSMRSLKGYLHKNSKLYQQNSDLLSKDIIEYKDIPVINSLYFRFHAHGELINEMHLINLCRICVVNPKVTFSLWTKRLSILNKVFDIRNEGKPKNLMIIYSNPYINKIVRTVPPLCDKIFNNVDKDKYIDEQNCTGRKCIECLTCYTDSPIDVIVEGVK